MKNIKKRKIVKIVLTIASIALFIGLIIYLFPTIKGLVTPQGRMEFKTKLDNMGIGKFFIMAVLQLMQILLVVLPGEPLEMLAGMCFGTFWGTVFILVIVFLATSIIFFLVRKYGKLYVEQFFKKEKLDKIQNSKFFRNPKNVELIMIILFIIPGTPKDLLVYLGGLLPIKPLRFILISTFARFPSVISSTLMGASILNGNLKFSIFIYALTFVIVAVIIFVVNKFDKNKITKDAINVIK